MVTFSETLYYCILTLFHFSFDSVIISLFDNWNGQKQQHVNETKAENERNESDLKYERETYTL